MTTTSKPASNDADIAAANGDSMEQIRELLFGQQQRLTDERLQHTDARIESLRQEALQQLSEVEQGLNDRLQRLDTDSGDRLDTLATELRQGIATLQQQMEQRLDDLQTLLQSEATEQARQLGEEQDRLQKNKVDRQQIARLLTQLAQQIQDND